MAFPYLDVSNIQLIHLVRQRRKEQKLRRLVTGNFQDRLHRSIIEEQRQANNGNSRPLPQPQGELVRGMESLQMK